MTGQYNTKPKPPIKNEVHRLEFDFRTMEGMQKFFDVIKTLGRPFDKCVIVYNDALHKIPQHMGGAKLHEYLVKSDKVGNGIQIEEYLNE